MAELADEAVAAVDIGLETLERMSKVDRYNQWLYSKVEPYVGKRILEVGSGTGNMSAFLIQRMLDLLNEEHGRPGGEADRLRSSPSKAARPQALPSAAASDCAVDRPAVVLSDLSVSYRNLLQARHGARPNVAVMPWNLEDAPPAELVEKRIDTVMCLNVLEHVSQDEVALRHMRDVLAPGGRLLLMVPAVKLLYGSLDKNLDHFRRYGKAELLSKLSAAGLVLERHFYMNFFGMLGWFLNARVFRRPILSTRQLGLFNKFAPFFIALERRLWLPVGLSLVAIARRRED